MEKHLVTIDPLQERYEEAEEFAHRAYNILGSIQGMNHPGTVYILISLGGIYVKSKKDLANTEWLYQQALDIYNTILESDHTDVFEALSCLAIVNQLQEKLEPVEEFCLKALRVQRVSRYRRKEDHVRIFSAS